MDALKSCMWIFSFRVSVFQPIRNVTVLPISFLPYMCFVSVLLSVFCCHLLYSLSSFGKQLLCVFNHLCCKTFFSENLSFPQVIWCT